jgi:hypothetical protein
MANQPVSLDRASLHLSRQEPASASGAPTWDLPLLDASACAAGNPSTTRARRSGEGARASREARSAWATLARPDGRIRPRAILHARGDLLAEEFEQNRGISR